ncbi:TPA: hypothetical protein ACKRTC_002460 [Proteus mirabilis]|uniref:hypothetical protein n=1 Tax=Proteus mirabilis TaxID=584 RepID=UPI0006683F4E|nr:hypothetical protein [Proteus mirabilis]MBI6505722.1 hypothetical protein [Proteus mirabilis]HCB2897693.1 hypothetical protein [Proteus mirabilis]HCB2909852.1 hypothetical protein [Proteus mirabilis]HCT3694894.1 hypothetical protein [Proteus mirabilis]HEJ1044702.1 hypothetical protein [Proteus mirabilis]
MNKIKKNITVRFFSIDTSESFFNQFHANFLTNFDSTTSSRITNIRNIKYLIKTLKFENGSFYISVVKERNTWQAKATRDGNITGLTINQGIIGDPYYFCVVPDKKIILGFTTGPIGSLKSVAKFTLEQFNSIRKEKIQLSLIPKEKDFIKLLKLPDYSSLHFKINSSSLIDISDDAPILIKNLSSAPYIENNIQLSLDLECSNNIESAVTKENIIEIVNFLSDSDACSILKVKGIDENGKKVNLDFGNAFMKYKFELNTRSKYIDEKTSIMVLSSALNNNIIT